MTEHKSKAGYIAGQIVAWAAVACLLVLMVAATIAIVRWMIP